MSERVSRHFTERKAMRLYLICLYWDFVEYKNEIEMTEKVHSVTDFLFGGRDKRHTKKELLPQTHQFLLFVIFQETSDRAHCPFGFSLKNGISSPKNES